MPKNMKPKFIIYHGLPGSGKSTQALEQSRKLKEEGIPNTIVNRDTIREDLYGKDYLPSREKEDEVTKVQHALIRNALSKGNYVISDDTNLNPQFLPELLKIGKEFKTDFEQVYVDTPVQECLRRNKKRASEGGRFVPEYVIHNMAKNAYDPSGSRIKRIEINADKLTAKREIGETAGSRLLEEASRKMAENNPITQSKKVVLVDVDGTLSDDRKAANRAFYDQKRKDFDYFFKSIKFAKPNKDVVDLANNLRDKEDMSIIILTGRSDSSAKELLEFIEKTGIKSSRVIAKKEGDYRPDNVFKKEALEGLQKEGLILAHSIDDRQRSVDAYRSMGIPVSRVEEHEPEDPTTAPDSYPPLKIDTPYSDYFSKDSVNYKPREILKEKSSGSSSSYTKKGNYHLSSDGTIRPCRANTKPCPYDGNLHGDTEEEIYQKLSEIEEEHTGLNKRSLRNSSLDKKPQKIEVNGSVMTGARVRTLGRGGNYWGINVPDEFVEKAQKELAKILPKEQYENYTKAKEKRDNGKSHVTVVSPPNSQKLYDKGIDVGKLCDKTYDLKMKGIGRVKDEKTGNEAYYAVIESQELSKASKEMGLPRQDYHVTLAFKGQDVHGVSKGEETLIKKF